MSSSAASCSDGSPKLLLCLDASGPACRVALLDGEAVAATACVEEHRGGERHFPALTREVMTGADFTSLDAIAVCAGPGSFTGVRAGIAFARALALAVDRPSFGVTAPAALYAACDCPRRCLVALPARRSPPGRTWWIQGFCSARPDAQPVEADAERLVREAARAGLLAGFDATLAEQAATAGCTFRTAEFDAVHVGRAVRFGLVDSSPALPVYVRPPDARPGLFRVVAPSDEAGGDGPAGQ